MNTRKGTVTELLLDRDSREWQANIHFLAFPDSVGSFSLSHFYSFCKLLMFPNLNGFWGVRYISGGLELSVIGSLDSLKESPGRWAGGK